MWHLILSLFLIISVVVSATPFDLRQAPSADLKFTCPRQLRNALCCSNDLQGNGAVKDCQESRYIVPNPASNPGSLKTRCTTTQLNNGYDTPVYCNTKVRTLKFENGALFYLGVNCMDAEDVSVGVEKPETPRALKTSTLDTSKFTRYSPLDHRQENVPTVTRPHANGEVKTPTPLWRGRRASKKIARRNLKKSSSAASKSRNSVANTIINDLKSASSRAIVRNATPKTKANARSGQVSSSKSAGTKEERQLGGLSSLGVLSSLTKLLGGVGGGKTGGLKQARQLGGLGGLGGLSSFTKLLGGLGGVGGLARRAAAMLHIV